MADDLPLVNEVLPVLAEVMMAALTDLGEHDLAGQVQSLRVVKPCSCDDDFCQSFTTATGVRSPYPDPHRTVPLIVPDAMVNVDVVGNLIVYVEIIL